MMINGKEVSVDDLLNDFDADKDMIKHRANNLYLSDEEVETLKKYDINYLAFSSLNSLILKIEEVLNNDSDLEDLEALSLRLSELNYYNNTNK